MSAPQPSAETAWAIAQTIHRLFHALDGGRYDEVASLFAPDGVWVRLGADLEGPQAVLAAMRARPEGLVTRHIVSNLIVDAAGAAMEARYYVTVFDHEGGAQGPAPLGGPDAIFLCEDRLAQTEEGWRFLRRAPQPVFRRR